MVDDQKMDSSLLELAIQRELARRKEVPCPKDEPMEILSQTPSFKHWTDNGSISDASLKSLLALHQEPSSPNVQPPSEIPRLPSSSPGPQNQMGQSPIKNGTTRNPTSAPKNWIGPSKLSHDKFQTHNSSFEVPPLVPFLRGSPTIHRKTPPLSPILKLETIPKTNVIQKPEHFPTATKTRPILKRKATGSELQFQPSRGSSSPPPNSINNKITKKSMDNLLCELCQVSCSSALTLQQHLNGRPHKAKLEWMKLKRNCTGDRSIGKPRCDVCQIWCSDGNALGMHLKGQKHKTKLQELEFCKKKGGESTNGKKPILCELCLVHCMNEDLFKMHLKGRPHAAREELKRQGLL